MSYSQRVDRGYLSLARGLVTESSALAAAEGSTSAESNMTLDMDGMIRKRRLGAKAISPDSLFDGRFETGYYWEANDFLVVIFKDDAKDGDITGYEDYYRIHFHFYEAATEFSSKLPLHTYTILIEKGEYGTPQFTELRDRLICTYGAEPVVFRISDEGEISIWTVRIHIRDFKLIDDGLSVGQRFQGLTDEHRYNLLNAGWWQHRRLKSTGNVGNPVTDFYNERGVYPSNADVAYLGDVTNEDGDLVFDPEAYDNLDVGNSEAPRGHYVYYIRTINRNAKLTAPLSDGTPNRTLIPILIDGNDPGTGNPPPSGPIYDPPPTCPGGEICLIEP